MTNGWRRVCPQCGNRDGAKVARIAFHPTFQCECGYIWDGSGARLLGVFKVEADASNEELDALATVIFARMEACASRVRARPGRTVR
jgi:hypothetical protein